MRHIPGMLLFALVSGLCGIASHSQAQERHASDLTANDLAEALSIHWWIVKLPQGLKPNAQVIVESISSDGKVQEGGGGLGLRSGMNSGDAVRIFCWEAKDTHTAHVVIKTGIGDVCGVDFPDYFKGAATSAPGNGTVLKDGDVLIKFDDSKSPVMTGGNDLRPGQTGLRVTIAK